MPNKSSDSNSIIRRIIESSGVDTTPDAINKWKAENGVTEEDDKDTDQEDYKEAVKLDFDFQLDRIEDEISRRLEPFRIPSTSGKSKGYRPPDGDSTTLEEIEEIVDASISLESVREYQRKEYWDWMGVECLKLCQLLIGLKIRPYEKAVERGLKNIKATSKGGRMRAGKESKRKKEEERWRKAIEQRRKDNPHESPTAACKWVARDEKVVWRTIWERVGKKC